MLSIRHPSILSHLGQFAYGLQPVHVPPEDCFILIIKMSKEAILTARLNQQIKIYLVPDMRDEKRSHGFITAFFDDHDEPIVLFSPLCLYQLFDMALELGEYPKPRFTCAPRSEADVSSE